MFHMQGFMVLQYKGTINVLYKIIQQEGFARLWRGTNAGLALAVPMLRTPSMWEYIYPFMTFCNSLEELTSQRAPSLTLYGPLVAGSLACSLACASFYPIELARTRMQVASPGCRSILFTSTKQPYQSNGVLWAQHGIHGTVSIWPPECFQYEGTLDVFHQIISQEGFATLWRGTYGGLALAVPTVGIYHAVMTYSAKSLENLTPQRELQA